MKRAEHRKTPRSGTRIPNSLLALGSAAVLAIYSAGNLQTLEAARQFDDDGGGRRRPPPSGATEAGDDGGSAVSDAGAVEPARPDGSGETATDGEPTEVANAPSLSERASVPVQKNLPDASAAADRHIVAAATVKASAKSAPSAAVALSAEPVVSELSEPSVKSEPVKTASVKAEPVKSEPVKPEAVKPEAVKPEAVKAESVKADSSSASAPTEKSTAAADTAVKAFWRDGTFSGWGTSRHGNIEATVVIEGGRIVSATISRCLTRYSCSWITHLQQQVVTRQSPDVDYVSGATQSANAFYYAVFEALHKAQ